MDTESDRGSSGRVDRPGQGDGCWDGTWTKHGDEDPLFPDEHLSFTQGSRLISFSIWLIVYTDHGLYVWYQWLYMGIHIYIYIYPWRTPTHSPKHLQPRTIWKTISLPHLSNTLQVMMTSTTEIFVLEEHIDHWRFGRPRWTKTTNVLGWIYQVIRHQLPSRVGHINQFGLLNSINKSFNMDIFSDLIIVSGNGCILHFQLVNFLSLNAWVLMHHLFSRDISMERFGEIPRSWCAAVRDAPLHGGLLRDVCFRRT